MVNHPHGFAACSGCSLCLLPCPVWRETGDVLLTPKGRARALQGGATAAELADSAAACWLCGACEPVCPEGIDTVRMVLDLRGANGSDAVGTQQAAPLPVISGRRTTGKESTVLLPDAALEAAPDLLARIVRLLGGPGRAAVADHDGREVAGALEAGAPVPDTWLASFLTPLTRAREIIVADGLLARHLQPRLPDGGPAFWRRGPAVLSPGEALIRLDAVRRALRPTDLYVIDPRAYHADFERLVRVYDRLRRETGCQMNLDLHRLAIPTGSRGGSPSLPLRVNSLQFATPQGDTLQPAEAVAAGAGQRPALPGQLRWLLEGRRVERIVVEDAGDLEFLRRHAEWPAVHVAELATPAP